MSGLVWVDPGMIGAPATRKDITARTWIVRDVQSISIVSNYPIPCPLLQISSHFTCSMGAYIQSHAKHNIYTDYGLLVLAPITITAIGLGCQHEVFTIGLGCQYLLLASLLWGKWILPSLPWSIVTICSRWCQQEPLLHSIAWINPNLLCKAPVPSRYLW